MKSVTDNPSGYEDAKADRERRVIVVVGASAGGLSPLQELFGLLPTDAGMTFVVVQHLSPDFDSVMDELLARHTEMEIKVADDGMELQPNTVYLNPARMDVEVVDHEFVLRPFDPSALRLPINAMFRSVANEYGADVVAVVLSGTGSDGAEGIKAVRDHMGLTIVQSVDTAQFDGMPKNAIATGMVDYILSPPAIAHLIREHGSVPVEAPVKAREVELVDDNLVQVIFSLLAEAYEIDFSHYKPTTVSRRIDRRLALSRYRGLREYVEVLQADQQELSNLYHDLLIGVTSFFRDRDAYELLKEELGNLIGANEDGESLRIWCAGCASGEEAYSIAIVLTELYNERRLPARFKVFATDVHDLSLDHAARGLYEEGVLDALSGEQKQQFFEKVGGSSFRVRPELRNHLVFARQNVVHDPPFTNMDLVTCRNLLIYLQDEAQFAAISSFRFALKSNGLMMLGPSETLGRLSDGFDVLHKGWRLFRKNARVRLTHRPSSSISRASATTSSPPPTPSSATYDLVKAESKGMVGPSISSEVLSGMMQCTIMVDGSHAILEIYGQAGDYLPLSHRREGVNLVDAFHGAEQAAIYTVIAQARDTMQVPFVANDLMLNVLGKQRLTTITATGYHTTSALGPVVLLQFENLSDKTDTPAGDSAGDGSREQPSEVDDDRKLIATLRRELAMTRETLGASIHELEANNEEMQSTNEEMIASNEELQATNEELQSVNEELHTVNIEHQRKVLELQEVTEDFDNLFNSTRVGLILLDDNLRIRKFTRASDRYFNLLEHDVGRQLSNFAPRVKMDNFFGHVREVMSSGVLYHVNTRHQDDHLISIEVSPFRKRDKVSGVIISIIDVTDTQMKAEAAKNDGKVSGENVQSKPSASA
ncbi:chemotaxis protein CheB [Planctomycetes bacterium K23_9]|uniref:Chemotaxis protein methyltransferase n=1 Tax=Stieleria marina TaxID=1930275 RepID=A0A517NWU6_9BACT|nr:Chemotaxis protein methyltransferase [Planctomycetes bacterium K23_9]